MNYYFVITDTNSRQYPFVIPEEGLKLETSGVVDTIYKDDPLFDIFFEVFEAKSCFVIDDRSFFNTNNLASVELKCSEGSY